MLGYRADIDGLRAIAVLSVLFFHIDISLFSGGFVGVDIFFTISGFLITSILLKAKQSDSFSFREFYARRAFRILPAYLVLVFVTTIVGLVLLAPVAYKLLLESTIASSLFASNVYFLFTLGGYFSAAAHELPLLHTWSLSVEEQFYLLMPLAVVLWFKIACEAKRLWVLFGVFVLSVLVSILLTGIHQKTAYFVVFSRAHEFLIGSILSVLLMKYGKTLVPSKMVSNFVFSISVITLILSTIFINAKLAFPGYLALIPCLATVLVIYSGLNEKCLSHKLLGNKVMVFVGLLSYSLYLYHWPVVAYAKYVGVEFTPAIQFLIVLTSFVFAYLSQRFVENKVRYASWSKQNFVAPILYLAPSVVLIFIYFHANINQFYPERFTAEVVLMEKVVTSKPEKDRASCHSSSLDIDSSNNCQLGAINEDNKAILWGDSHANHFVGFIDELGKKGNFQVQDITMGNCPPLPNLYIAAQGAGKACIEKNKAVLSYILQERPDEVFLAGSWAGYLGSYIQADTQHKKVKKVTDTLSQLIDKLHENNIKVTFFEMLPRTPDGVSACYLKHIMYPSITSIKSCEFSQLGFYGDEQLEIYQALKDRFHSKFTVISVSDLFCENLWCKSYMNATALYRDNNHLNLQGSRLLGRKYAAELVL